MEDKRLNKLIENRIKEREENNWNAWFNVIDFFGRIITAFAIIVFGTTLLPQVANIESDYIFIITLTCSLAICYSATAMAYSAINKLNISNKK